MDDAVPASQKKKALEDVNKAKADAQAQLRGARTEQDRERYYADVMGAEVARAKINQWRTK